MSSFDYLAAIKQRGCTLQQVARCQQYDQGYLSQLLNAKIKAPAQKLEALRFWGLSFPGRNVGVVFGKFYYYIPDISTLSTPVAVDELHIIMGLTIPVTARCSKTVPCRSNRRAGSSALVITAFKYQKIFAFMLSTKGHGAVSTAGMCGRGIKSLWLKRISRI